MSAKESVIDSVEFGVQSLVYLDLLWPWIT